MGNHQLGTKGVGELLCQLFPSRIDGAKEPFIPHGGFHESAGANRRITEVFLQEGHPRHVVGGAQTGVKHGFRLIGVQLIGN
jgi:hypothetical protein